MYLRKRLCLLTAGMAVMLCGCTSYQFKDNIANANEMETYTYEEDGEKVWSRREQKAWTLEKIKESAEPVF